MRRSVTEKDILVHLACIAHGADVENKTYGVMADAMKEELDELGWKIVRKPSVRQVDCSAHKPTKEELRMLHSFRQQPPIDDNTVT